MDILEDLNLAASMIIFTIAGTILVFATIGVIAIAAAVIYNQVNKIINKINKSNDD